MQLLFFSIPIIINTIQKYPEKEGRGFKQEIR